MIESESVSHKYGVYFLANDVVYDWTIAFLNSFRTFNEDALHIAIAITNGIDYLLTWNCKHIANAVIRKEIERICLTQGYKAVTICTPEELLEE